MNRDDRNAGVARSFADGFDQHGIEQQWLLTDNVQPTSNCCKHRICVQRRRSADIDEIDRLGTAIEKRESKLDILVNNAGASWGADFLTFPESGWDKVMDLNVKSAFFMTQRVFKLLQAAGSKDDYARVINIGSIEGMRTSHLEAYSYAASKAAILHLTRMMAKYLAKDHIAVNAIAPGYFPSKMTDAIAEEESEMIEGNTPMRRWGRPEDMAGVALYLASRASGFVCGSTVVVDGGLATTG